MMLPVAKHPQLRELLFGAKLFLVNDLAALSPNDLQRRLGLRERLAQRLHQEATELCRRDQ